MNSVALPEQRPDSQEESGDDQHPADDLLVPFAGGFHSDDH